MDNHLKNVLLGALSLIIIFGISRLAGLVIDALSGLFLLFLVFIYFEIWDLNDGCKRCKK